MLVVSIHVLVAWDMDNSSYMFKKLEKEYFEWGLMINIEKMKYLIISEEANEDLDAGIYKIKTDSFKYFRKNYI